MIEALEKGEHFQVNDFNARFRIDPNFVSDLDEVFQELEQAAGGYRRYRKGKKTKRAHKSKEKVA